MESELNISYKIFILDTFQPGGPSTFYGFIKAPTKDFETRDEAELWIRNEPTSGTPYVIIEVCTKQ